MATRTANFGVGRRESHDATAFYDRFAAPELSIEEDVNEEDREFNPSNDEFMQATLDVWDMPPESAQRVNHPAPFPVELPERLIHLYTYKNDLVLDPFLGSGTTLVAAERLDRRGAGYDLDKSYLKIAKQRLKTDSNWSERTRACAASA